MRLAGEIYAVLCRSFKTTAGLRKFLSLALCLPSLSYPFCLLGFRGYEPAEEAGRVSVENKDIIMLLGANSLAVPISPNSRRKSPTLWYAGSDFGRVGGSNLLRHAEDCPRWSDCVTMLAVDVNRGINQSAHWNVNLEHPAFVGSLPGGWSWKR